MKRTEGTTTDATGEQTQPLTAKWLKANTEIDGWLAFFVFHLVIAGLAAIVFPILTYNAADYFGSVLLGVGDCLVWWWQSFVAIFACLFDEKTGKVVVVRGGLLDKDVTDFERLLKSVRFTK